MVSSYSTVNPFAYYCIFFQSKLKVRKIFFLKFFYLVDLLTFWSSYKYQESVKSIFYYFVRKTSNPLKVFTRANFSGGKSSAPS